MRTIALALIALSVLARPAAADFTLSVAPGAPETFTSPSGLTTVTLTPITPITMSGHSNTPGIDLVSFSSTATTPEAFSFGYSQLITLSHAGQQDSFNLAGQMSVTGATANSGAVSNTFTSPTIPTFLHAAGTFAVTALFFTPTVPKDIPGSIALKILGPGGASVPEPSGLLIGTLGLGAMAVGVGFRRFLSPQTVC